MKKGFTLLELLVVIAIIGILSSFIASNYIEVRKKSRDAKRMSDLREIQKALELYRQNQSPPQYPSSLPVPCASLKDANGIIYLQSMPGDPKGDCSNKINYIYQVNDLDYILAACFESVTSGENVIDCSSIGVNCNSLIGANSNGKCYVLKP